MEVKRSVPTIKKVELTFFQEIIITFDQTILAKVDFEEIKSKETICDGVIRKAIELEIKADKEEEKLDLDWTILALEGDQLSLKLTFDDLSHVGFGKN